MPSRGVPSSPRPLAGRRDSPGRTGRRQGIVAFVTTHGFINNRVHRGVRKALLDAFDEIWVFNVHGNRRLAVRGVSDENVFVPVKQGVAMTVLVRRGLDSPGLAMVR
jgi:predicted helicase